MSQLNQQLTLKYPFTPEYSFENFIKTPSTALALDAALLVIRKPGGKYNPLSIYGGKGVGKTHLLQAIGNKARASSKEAEIVYVDSRSLVGEQEETFREFDMVSLVNQYKNVDFLIIDDIDILNKRPHLDEKIFHLYNYLIQKGKQLVFASSIPPAQLNFTDNNLKSRLQTGLSVKIGKMNDKDKRKVIKKLSKDFELFIPDNVVNYILNSGPRDFESLHKTVEQINRLSLETKKKITLPLVKKNLNLPMAGTTTGNKD